MLIFIFSKSSKACQKTLYTGPIANGHPNLQSLTTLSFKLREYVPHHYLICTVCTNVEKGREKSKFGCEIAASGVVDTGGKWKKS
jgi:hypothetical protein